MLAFMHIALAGLSSEDRTAMEAQYRLYAKSLFTFAFNIMHDKELAEDAVQESFYKAGKLLSHRDPEDKQALLTRAVLYTIVKNHCLDVLRKQKSDASYIQRVSDLNLSPEQVKYDDFIEQESRSLDLSAAMKEIGQEDAELLALRFAGGLKFRELAQVYHTTIPTIQRRIKKALEKMKRSDAIQSYTGGECE